MNRKEELKGMKWGELTEQIQEELLSNANCVNAETCESVENGECIVDLTDNLSVAGKVKDYEIIIDNESVIYDPAEGMM